MRPILYCVLLCAACSNTTVIPAARRDAGNPGTYCVEQCNVTADCLSSYTCVGGRCDQDNGAPVCRTTLECQGRMGAWRADCQDDRGCSAGFACVGDSSAGYCARVPTTITPCTQSTQEEMQMNRRDGTGVVTVCGVPRARCEFTTGVCFQGCRMDADCGGETPHCNAGTGLCQCTTTSCHTNSSVCERGVCRCAKDADCTHNANTCFDGACGCETPAICTQQRYHPGTSWVCE